MTRIALAALFVAALVAGGMIFAPDFAPAQTGAEDDFGPAIGATIDFGALPDQTGAERDFASLAGERGLVLMFVRSADWCPYCQAQLIDMNGAVAEMNARGYGMASLSYDAPEINAGFTERRDIVYPMLSDIGSQIIDRYGLRETRYEEGSRAYGVPKPIIFVLDRDGKIAAKLFESDYRVRPPATAVIETLEALNAGPPGA